MNQNGSFNFNGNGTFRIDLNLASSVAIMPNFLHSLIESRNPKLHLRSHMNVTEDQTAKICAEEQMWMTNICTLENDIDSGSFQIHIKFLWLIIKYTWPNIISKLQQVKYFPLHIYLKRLNNADAASKVFPCAQKEFVDSILLQQSISDNVEFSIMLGKLQDKLHHTLRNLEAAR
ncbi:hypothetical protein P8452_51901 [Trifolium repens]|nr:hypothetical protein P8452_51901 [Trifolium repens]